MMFWLSTALNTPEPRPPIPTPKMFNLSLGATCPKLLPNTVLGTIVGATANPMAAVAPVWRNFLLEMFDAISKYFIG
jgi:hypothetical protein